jgi:CRISPR/Cas system endoribonuclease Cas6 (RAMP superfamily)
VGDVSALDFLLGPYDYALDIGCLFTLQPARQARYVTQLSRLLRSGADYMLYAWLPRQYQGKSRGLSPQTVAALFAPSFHQSKMEIGRDGPGDSAWYWFTKT